MPRPNPEVAEFLAGKELAERIVHVAGGERLRCAVAFWSEDGVARLFPNGVPAGAKFLCDISMGSTSATALKLLGAPDNGVLRHARGMHGKLYLSSRGLIVGSANASGNALGRTDRDPPQIETGVFHPRSSDAWSVARAWFRASHRTAAAVGERELDWAETNFRPPRPPAPMPLPGSLLSLVRAAPDRFAQIGFVFTGEKITRDQIKEVRRGALEKSPVPELVTKLPDSGIYHGWGAKAARRWPTWFISFWQPARALWVAGRRLEVRVPPSGGVMSVGDWVGLQAEIGLSLPAISAIRLADAALAARIAGGRSRIFYSGQELADRITKLEGEDALKTRKTKR